MRHKKAPNTIIVPPPYCYPAMFTIACHLLGLSKQTTIREFFKFGGRKEDLNIVKETWETECRSI